MDSSGCRNRMKRVQSSSVMPTRTLYGIKDYIMANGLGVRPKNTLHNEPLMKRPSSLDEAVLGYCGLRRLDSKKDLRHEIVECRGLNN